MMDLDTQSLDHDERLGVEALEDIIDVENEAGFGEGEEWSCDDGTIGYVKLAASRKHGLINKANAIHGRHHSNGLFVHQQRLQKPLTLGRNGHKPCTLSTTDEQDLLSQTRVLVSPRVKNAFGQRNDGARKLILREESKKGANVVNQDLEPQKENPCSMDQSLDDQDMQRLCMDLDARIDSIVEIDTSKHQDFAQREINGEDVLKLATAENAEEQEQIEMKNLSANKDEKAAGSNKVRFSIDVETADKATGNANRKSTGAKGKGKCEKQEWRYTRSTPGDCHGSGVPKVPSGAAVKTKSALQRKELSMSEDPKDPLPVFDLAKALEMRDEKKTAKLAIERAEMFEDAILKQQDVVANMKLSLSNEGLKDYAKFRQLVDSLDRNIKKVTASSKVRQVPQSYELKNRAEQISKLKAQCNLLEMDKEKLKKKLRHFVENTNVKEKDLEVLDQGPELGRVVNERENLLEQKVKDLECSLAEWEKKVRKVESDFATERALLEDSLSVCKLDWRNKQQRWLSKMKEREAELLNMRASQDKLVNSLMSCRQCMDQLRREAAACRRELAPHPEIHEEDVPPKSDDDTNALGLAYSIQNDMESLRRLLAESSSVLQENPGLRSEVLRQENKVLEDKVAQTINLMSELKQEMKVKEDVMKKENEKYAGVVAEKAKQLETLKVQLASKEQDVEGRIQDLQDKVNVLNKALECERSENSRLSELHGNMKYKVLKGLRKKEQKLEEEIEGKNERLEGMKMTVAQKDEKIATLEDELSAKCAQLDQEKQKWNLAIKEVKQKAAKTILRFMHGKENGLLEHLRERKKSQKTGYGQTGSSYKTGDNGDDDDDCDDKHEGLSKNGVKHSHHNRRYQARLPSSGLADSPRHSHCLLSSDFETLSDLRSSFESYKEKARLEEDRLLRNKDLCLQDRNPKAFELARRNWALDNRDT